MFKQTPLSNTATPYRESHWSPRQNRRVQQAGATAALVAAAAAGTCLGEFDAEKYFVYNFGDISLRPRLEVSEVYSSNLFYAETDQVSDLTSYLRPGFGVLYGDSQEDFVSLSYATDIAVHATRNDLDYIGHIVGQETRLKRARTTFQAQDNFTISRTTLGGSFSYIQKPVGVNSLSDDWKIDYNLTPKTLVEAGVQFGMVDYDAADLGDYRLYDYKSITGTTKIGYMPSEKVVLFPQFSYSRTFLSPNSPKYGQSPDLSALSFSLGAQGEFTPKLSGTVSAGYEIREYEDNTQVPDGWIANLELRWQARPKTTVSLGFRHWIQVTRDSAGSSSIADRPSISISQQLGTQGRWTVSATGYYQMDDYNVEYLVGKERITRSDDLLGFGFRSSYRWTAWLTCTAAYDFSSYRDNLPSVPDYDVHLISLLATAGF